MTDPATAPAPGWLPSSASVHSALRHVYTATAAVTAVLVIVGFSQGDATGIGVAVHKIGDGAASIIEGVSMLVAILTPLYAGWRRSQKQMITDVDAMPDVAGVVTKDTPDGRALARDVPSKTVVAAGTSDAAKVADS
jgi:hypothetical protein